jgi:hypothetical protein
VLAQPLKTLKIALAQNRTEQKRTKQHTTQQTGRAGEMLRPTRRKTRVVLCEFEKSGKPREPEFDLAR